MRKEFLQEQQIDLVYNFIVRILTVFFLFIQTSLVFATEYSYKELFNFKITENEFIYKSKLKDFKVDINKCNKKIITEVLNKLKDKKSIVRLPSKLKTQYYLKDEKKVYFVSGSQVHINLEKMDTLIVGIVSRAKNKCKN